jgi:hypothetical protein
VRESKAVDPGCLGKKNQLLQKPSNEDTSSACQFHHLSFLIVLFILFPPFLSILFSSALCAGKTVVRVPGLHEREVAGTSGGGSLFDLCVVGVACHFAASADAASGVGDASLW